LHLFAAFDTLLGAVGSDVGQCVLVAAQGHLPASLGKAMHDCHVARGMLGGDAAWLLEHVPKEVVVSALSRSLCTVLGRRACAALASLAASLGLTMLNLPP
jgi:hypothetical protein